MDPILDDLLGWYRRLSKHSFAYRNIIGQAEDEDVSEFVTGVGGSGAVGQCILTLDSGSLKLIPYKGNQVYFPDGTTAEISSSGVTLAATGLSVDTNYYIYATKSGTAVNALEASTTARATDSSTGIEIKSGDSTRVLVGLVRVITGPAFSDTLTKRFVRTWFNDKGLSLLRSTGSAATSNTSATEWDSSNRLEFLVWANETVHLTASGYAYNNTSGNGFIINLNVDGGSNLGSGTPLDSRGRSTNANDELPFSLTIAQTFSEGYHYANPMLQATPGGTANAGGTVSGSTHGAP